MGDMTPDERDELRAALEAAGCPYLANAIGDFLGGAYITELRSLLRREERLATMEAGVRAADRLTDAGHISVNAERRYIGSIDDDMAALLVAVELLETEVPDGQG